MHLLRGRLTTQSRRWRCAALVLALLVAALPAAAEPPVWQVPDVDALPDDAFGRTARYGRDLIVHTASLLGPDAPDPAMRYAGNHLDCQSCHLDAGTKQFGLPLTVWGVFPTFIGRENEVRTLDERINGCMERSMNGRALPVAGPEMKALLTYIRAISDGMPTGASFPGRGAPVLKPPETEADLAQGARVYAATCAACHQPDGQGLRQDAAASAGSRHYYVFPPLWGPDSYNDGAGMARPLTAAQFIRANMPNGTTFKHPVLSENDAFAVAVFINSQKRPHLDGIEHDYPDRSLKPADATYAPFVGPFSPAQHLKGPWLPIQQWQRDNAARLKAEAGGAP
jgi:thiosulfate dehydrogenase